MGQEFLHFDAAVFLSFFLLDPRLNRLCNRYTAALCSLGSVSKRKVHASKKIERAVSLVFLSAVRKEKERLTAASVFSFNRDLISLVWFHLEIAIVTEEEENERKIRSSSVFLGVNLLSLKGNRQAGHRKS